VLFGGALATISEIKEDLQLALIGESWERDQNERALDSGNPVKYHTHHIQRNLDAADENKALAAAASVPAVRAWHEKKAEHHRKLAGSHAALRRKSISYDVAQARNLAASATPDKKDTGAPP
jgi:hypothetical protein